MTILLAGSSGFIGSNLLIKLLQQNNVVYHIDIKQRLDNDDKFMIHDSIKNIFNYDLFGIDAIVCCTGSTIPAASNDNVSYDIQTNLLDAIALLDYAKKLKVPKVIFLSTGGAIYGEPIYLPVDEKHPISPITSYAVTKFAIENYAKLYNKLYGIQTVALRLSNVYGTNQKQTAQGIIPIFISHIRNNEQITIYGDGTNIRDYIYVDDVCDAIIKALNTNFQKFEAINIGTGIGTSINDVLWNIGNLMGVQPNIKFEQARASDIKVNVLDIQFAKKILKWKPSVDILHGLQKCIKHTK